MKERVTAAVNAWRHSLKAATARTYQDSLTSLAVAAKEAGHPTTDVATLALWAVDAPDAFEEWTQAHLHDALAGAASTRRKRGSAVSGMLVALRRARLTDSAWSPELPERHSGAPQTPVAPVAWAPRADQKLELLELRTIAMLRLAECGLKLAAVLGLRFPEAVAHMPCVNVGGDRVFVSAETWAALQRWVDRRGNGPGWLFVSFDGRSGRPRNAPVSARSAERAARKLGVSMSSVRRRRIVDEVEARGVHHAAAVARIANPAEITAAMKSSWSMGARP